MNPFLTTLTLATGSAVILLNSCGKAPEPGSPIGAAHNHQPPHGGTAVELGDHQYHLEFLLDESASQLECYVLDGHLENFIRIDAERLTLQLPSGTTIDLLPVASRATGESVGDTSHFRASVARPEAWRSFSAVLPEITVKGTRFKQITVNYPQGNE